MLRPERMAKVSVTGSRRVMEPVIEAVHELGLVHLSDYDGSWAGFDNGNPIAGADEVSQKLVTVRALESTLDLSRDDHDPGRLEAGWEDRLEEIRVRINELDDERSELREELRLVDERIGNLAPFAELGIDLDLLSGYESVDVLVGEGDDEEIAAELEDADEIRAFETFTGGDVVAIVAAPVGDDTDGVIADALVSVEFTSYEVPDVDSQPAAYLDELDSRRAELETELGELDDELARIKAEEGPFLLRVEQELTVDVQQAEAPLRFATTERAFVAEGWIPAADYDDLVATVRDAVGDSVEIERIEVADYDRGHDHGHHETGDVGDEEPPESDDLAEEEEAEPEPAKAATDGGARKATDDSARKATDGGRSDGARSGAAAGGTGSAVTMDDEPPVVMDNLTPAKPFELMVEMVNHPKYSELDPTLIVFLTFPFAFGFMIGDIGYGILYMAMGYGMWKLFDGGAGRALGTIAIWAGAFTIIFGYLYDDIFGVHMADFLPSGMHDLMLGAGVLSKGLQTTDWAMFWIVMSIVFGLVHLNIGLIMGFINELNHGVKAAILEKFSWIMAMNGLFIWIFSLHLEGFKPAFLVGDESVLADSQALAFGFTGVPEAVGIAALAVALVGCVMVGVGEGITGLFEIPAWAFGHVLSYLRMFAVLLAKGGMAFVVNLLVFGGYSDAEGYTVFNLPTEDVAGLDQDFVGLIHIEPLWLGIPLAILVFVLGHILVLLLGITAAGIQMLRLEWVEFYQKFYEGGGEEYEPFGDERAYAAD